MANSTAILYSSSMGQGRGFGLPPPPPLLALHLLLCATRGGAFLDHDQIVPGPIDKFRWVRISHWSGSRPKVRAPAPAVALAPPGSGVLNLLLRPPREAGLSTSRDGGQPCQKVTAAVALCF